MLKNTSLAAVFSKTICAIVLCCLLGFALTPTQTWKRKPTVVGSLVGDNVSLLPCLQNTLQLVLRGVFDFTIGVSCHTATHTQCMTSHRKSEPVRRRYGDGLFRFEQKWVKFSIGLNEEA